MCKRAISLLTILLAQQAWAGAPETLRLYNGRSDVLVALDSDGVYRSQVTPSGLQFVTTHNYSYGNPFFIQDRNNQNILFRMLMSEDRWVSFWRVGRDDDKGFAVLEQSKYAQLPMRNCPYDEKETSTLIRVEYTGVDAEGNQLEMTETIVSPKAICPLDRDSYDVRMMSMLPQAQAQAALERFKKDLQASILEYFELKPEDYDLTAQVSPLPAPPQN